VDGDQIRGPASRRREDLDPVTAIGRRRVIVLVLAALTWTGGGGDDHGGGDPLFTTDQLAQLVAQPEDAPPGMRFDEAQSGPAPVDLLSQGVESARSRFEELGFRGGQTSIFVSTDPPPPAGTIIGSGAFIFEDSAAAGEALDIHRSVVIPEVMGGEAEMSAEDLGDEAFGFTFESGPAGGPGAIYEFRIGNAVFLVPGAGPSVDREALLELAHTVAARVRDEAP
jgi:hypothetical protein